MATAAKTICKVSPATASTSSKTAVKKTAASNKKEIKYSDKSQGQPELIPIFNTIKSLMKQYVKGTIKERGEKPGIYNLVSEKNTETAGRKFDEIYFASIIIQKGFVGFYYMPVYSVEGVREQLKPELLKCLKGKACFHIKKDDPAITEGIKEALKTGYDCYKKREWV